MRGRLTSLIAAAAAAAKDKGDPRRTCARP
jgi:hypothetical protein